MELNELKQVAIELMDALKARGLGEVEIKLDDAQIKIKAAERAPAIAAPAAQTPAAACACATPAGDESASACDAWPAGCRVEAPLVGTFYAAPAPDAPPFVLVGQKVKKGDTLCIIEAMKTMNEIHAPCDGTVVRILAEAGDVVEYKQVLVILEEA